MRLGALGSVSLRVVLALGASTGLTAAVALPMAYQAHEARSADEARPEPRPAVLGTTTIPVPGVDGPAAALVSTGLHWSETGYDLPAPDLDSSEISRPVYIFVALPSVTRVDIRVNDEPVRSDYEAPYELREGRPLDPGTLPSGQNSVTATVTFEDGRIELRRATFTVVD